MKDHYKKGDIVVCVGGTQKKGDDFSPNFSVCKVIEVGHQDLVLREIPERSFTKIEIAPASTCIKIDLPSSQVASSSLLIPKIGDLVYSIPSSRYDIKESFSGILYSIDFKFGKPSTCQLLCGEEFKTSQYCNLVVLQTDREHIHAHSI